MSQTKIDNKYKHKDFLSALKVIATILVVYVHGDNIFIYTDFKELPRFRNVLSVINATAVPIFYLTSGYLLFSKPFDYKTNIIKKCRSLLLPFFIWNTVWFLFETALFLYSPSLSDITDWSFQGILISYFGIPMSSATPIYAPLWFVRDLFILNVFSFVIKGAFDRINRNVILLAILILWFMPINICARQSICFFCLGGLFNFYKTKPSLPKPIVFTVVCGVLGVMIPFLSTYEPVIRCAVLFCIVSIMTGVLVFTNLQHYLAKLIPFSFAIYVMHGKLLSLVLILLVKLLPQTSFTIMLEYYFIPILIIGICVLISMLLSRICPSVYALSVGSRYVAKIKK